MRPNLELAGLGNWVDVMLFIKIEKAEEEQVWVEEGDEFISGTD